MSIKIISKCSEFDTNLFSDCLDDGDDDTNYASRVRAKHRTRVYISHEITDHDIDDDGKVQDTKNLIRTEDLVLDHEEGLRIGLNEDKENVEDLGRMKHVDHFKDSLQEFYTKDEDSGINSTSSSDSQERPKSKLVGILKSPGSF